ncbi:MAG TPA: hypothetical protein DEB17_00665 [Chlorobaculum sp.]|jgi:uncharacterized ion transporter superfamily protein YfcC|uniref:Uncharacterized protein n=1 Tax=Chlorobaculum tepidum (strain ATCC 49652 / DSM 12025 / NBRC 103806 / TLS) TaxID=194439 RepID=Q8KBX3_CHLTE|nr:hypothetical protein [Chlorobaculum tepidum]AAM72884.1 hypothetical protein CT1659 [Chlorobaculum tepidum TLS]HBU22512.1 hypothetical protein [Chlorobaculum sp.]
MEVESNGVHQYTEQQKQAFKNEFANRRRNQIVLFGLLFILMILYVTADKSTGLMLGTYLAAIFTPLLLVVVIGALVFFIYQLAVPGLQHKYLGRSMNPHFCWKCGIALS